MALLAPPLPECSPECSSPDVPEFVAPEMPQPQQEVEHAAPDSVSDGSSMPRRRLPPPGPWRVLGYLLVVFTSGVIAAWLAGGDAEDRGAAAVLAERREEAAAPRAIALPSLTEEVELPLFPAGLQVTPFPTDIPKEERKRRKDAYDTAACVGHVLGAVIYEAGLALEIQAAFEDCAEARRLAQELAEEERNGTEHMPAWKHVLGLLQKQQSAQNGTTATTTTLSPQQKEQKRAIKRQELTFLRAKCARDILSVLRDISVITALSAEALNKCGGPDTSCAKNVAASMKQATSLGQAGAEMRIDCPAKLKDAPDSLIYRALDKCAEKLEKVSWEGGNLFRAISLAEETCNNIQEKGNPFFDELSCAGSIIASVSYMGAAGLWLTSAIQRDCVLGRALQNVNKTALKMKASPREYELLIKALDEEKAECARDITGFARTLGIAAWKATRAAGWCGGMDVNCGVNVLQSATGMFASAESSARTRLNCYRTDLNAKPLDVEINQVKCTVSSASLVKELAVTAAWAIEAVNSCPNTTYAAVECGSSITKTLATLAYLTERSALAQRRCGLDFEPFGCGRAIDDVGSAVNLLPRAIAGAVVNCGLGLYPRITKPLRGPRRFWVPA